MRHVLLVLAAGVVAALSLPPWGFWPLAVLGLAGLYRLLEDQAPRRRVMLGWVFGLGFFGVGWFWFGEFSLPGALLSILFESLFLGAAAFVVPPRRGRALAFPAALVLAEVLRGAWPFEGLPLAGIALGQVGGPLAPAARWGGGLALLALATAAAVALLHGSRRQARAAGAAVLVAVLGAGAGAIAPDGGPDRGRLDVALVQGGGRRGYRAADSDPALVEEAHFAATEEGVDGDFDVVLWPEDVIDVEEGITTSPEGDDLALLADALDTTLVVGVTEGEGTDGFRNAAVAWGPDGRLVDRYEKVRRVPFGEYIPFRGIVEDVGDVSDVPRDAIKGDGPGVLDTPAGRLGVLISYEVFFNDRGRAAVRTGAEVLLVPTNAASFSTSQVPEQELAAARLRARETGRWLAQAGPTGYTAVVDPNGRVLQRTALGKRGVLTAALEVRTGRTLFVRWGDVPAIVLAAVLLLAGLAIQARTARQQN
jgi:apolipoprotein N-acyltransferase